MSIFTRLRNALALAAEVEQLRAQVQQIQFEWGDTLDKLLAREERMRKRYKAEVDRGLVEGTQARLDSAQPTPLGRDRKDHLRRQLAASRAGNG